MGSSVSRRNLRILTYNVDVRLTVVYVDLEAFAHESLVFVNVLCTRTAYGVGTHNAMRERVVGSEARLTWRTH